MGGLNLETFLHLLRADLAAWATLAMIVVLMAIMTWTSWGSRRALRKCLVLSVLAHGGLVLYGSTVPSVRGLFQARQRVDERRERIRRVELVTPDFPVSPPGAEGADGLPRRPLSPWDRVTDDQTTLAMNGPSPSLRPAAPSRRPVEDDLETDLPPSPPAAQAAPQGDGPDLDDPESRRDDEMKAPAAVAPGDPENAVEPQPDTNAPPQDDRDGPLPRTRTLAPRPRERLELPGEDAAPLPASRAETASNAPPLETNRPSAEGAVAPPLNVAEGDMMVPIPVPRVARSSPIDTVPLNEPIIRSRPRSNTGRDVPREIADEASQRPTAIPIGPATPAPRETAVSPANPIGPRPRADVPEVYRPRLDPDRSARALRSGASPASEQAVERALDWLARHQDTDGRWNGGTAKYADGSTARGEDSYMVHCPPGEVCFGECFYAEADTALTGLALLAYLGAGYSHLDGKYAGVIARGLDFLLQSQKADGDLRGPSRAVGMYCHAMAALALCEAYALTGDQRLRGAVERAVDFTARARAAGGNGWRYLPGDTRGGDTSILGWVVMVLKSAREVGVNVPPEAPASAARWLDRVAGGANKGLASYQPASMARSKRDGEVTPTMTAEAWVCRQFLGTGGPGLASDEAAEYLLATNPANSPMNIYYWYYGTLAMYQHGGSPWSRWNAQVRDQLVKTQHKQGHKAGSWDPDETDYGARGGRVYGTALATLTLEVYYRYLRLYDAPATPLAPRTNEARPDPVRRTSTRTP